MDAETFVAGGTRPMRGPMHLTHRAQVPAGQLACQPDSHLTQGVSLALVVGPGVPKVGLLSCFGVTYSSDACDGVLCQGGWSNHQNFHCHVAP